MKKSGILALVFGVAFAGASFAANLNIGVVNFQKILSTSPKVAAASSQLRKQFKPQQDALKAKQQKLQALVAKLKRNASVMSNSDKQKLQNQILQERKDLFMQSQKFQQTVMTAQQKTMHGIMGKLNTIVKNVAEKNHLDIVLARNSVAYANDNLDYTKQVQDALK